MDRIRGSYPLTLPSPPVGERVIFGAGYAACGFCSFGRI